MKHIRRHALTTQLPIFTYTKKHGLRKIYNNANIYINAMLDFLVQS